MRFVFEAESPPSKCYIQIANSIFKIPRFTGKPPPAYPGRQPSPTNIKNLTHGVPKPNYSLNIIPYYLYHLMRIMNLCHHIIKFYLGIPPPHG